MNVSSGSNLRRLFIAGPARILAAVVLGLASGGATKAATLTAALDRATIYEGETAEVSVTVQNARSGVPPTPPEVAGLTFSAAQMTQQQMWVNGVYTSSQVYRFSVEPAGVGEYTIPAFSLILEGVTMNTRPLRLKVLPGQNPAIRQFAFLRLRTEKQRVYVGEVLPVEIEVAYRRGGEYREAPQLGLEGLTMGRMEQLSRRVERIGGAEYAVDPFRSYVIAARAGKLKLGPATLPFGVPVQSRLGLFGHELRAVKLVSSAIELEVLPLPVEGMPAGFTGAVGQYTMAVEASTNAVTEGDPILLTVEISGEGPIQSLQLESSEDWEGFKTYAPETTVELKDKLGLEGAKRFTQVVIPLSPEVKEMPPMRFTFFDPVRESYQTLSHEAVPITVRRGAVVAAYPAMPGAANGETDASDVVKEIVHIKSRLGSYGAVQPPLVLRPWFLGLQAVPLVAWLGTVVWRWRQAKLARDPRLRRRRHVARLVLEGLGELREAAGRNDAEVFFATVFRLLQERLGERAGLPASSVDELILDEVFKGKIDEGLLAEVHGLFQACNAARYAPGRLNTGLGSFIPKVVSVLDRLKDVDCRL